jgi:SAM-dependent methyltransferase
VVMQPLHGRGDESPWGTPATVAGFASSPPNQMLVDVARRELARHMEPVRALDLGCGAGRNALALAGAGWDVTGIDSSRPMLDAAAARATGTSCRERLHLLEATMDRLPVAGAAFDILIAHGIWNLASSSLEFRRALGEAARVARPGALLFVFTFSRATLPDAAQPVSGESFVFTQFSGRPQVFLARDELLSELTAVGFAADQALPLRELNRPPRGALQTTGPVIHEGAFRRLA